jgi:hypothetical protein
MSYLARPRLHFWGKALVNPPTANNSRTDWNDVPYFDPSTATLDLGTKSPEQFRQWMHQLNYEGYVNALWNYYGDNGIRFVDTKIIAAELPDGRLLNAPERDSCIGSSVQLLGSPYQIERSPAVLVDLDPTDGFTTQLFAQHLRIQNTSATLLEADAPVKAYSRWINAWRNLEVAGDSGSSAMWQLAFPKESIQFPHMSASPALQSLSEALETEQGLVIRLCFYLFYHRPYPAVAAAYAANQRVSLPGTLIVSGTIGVWGWDEPATLPAARILMPNIAAPLPIPDQINSQRRFPTFYLGAALAKTDTTRKVITLDVVNTFPEVAGFDTLNADIQDVPEKINLGDMTLQVIDPNTQDCYCIGVIPFASTQAQAASYNKSSTLLTGGIIELPYDPQMEDQIIHGDLVLMQGTAPDAPIVLNEQPYHVLLDERSLYCELEDPTTKYVPFQVLLRGQPLANPLVLRVEQSMNDGSAGTASQADLPLQKRQMTEISGLPEHTQSREPVIMQQGGVADMPTEITTDAQGYGVLPITPRRAGMSKIWLYTPADPDLTQVNFGITRNFLKNSLFYYINVRVLPDDSHYDQIPDVELTWEFMVEHFFRYYSLLYPIMNSYINFDDAQQTQAKAALIHAFVAEDWLASTLYMPITRELSAGKRRLVQRWAALQK